MMFSNFGKLLTYRLHILSHKDEILSPTKPSQSPNRVKRHTKNNEEIPLTILDQPSVEHIKDNKPATPKPMHMFRSQSREDFYKSRAGKSQAPPIGYYNCRYSYVSKSPKVVDFRKKRKTESKIVPFIETQDSFMKYSPQPKISLVAFQKQTSRKDIFVKELNENRFVSYNSTPEVCSNFKRVGTPNIARIKAREELIKTPEHLNSYCVELKQVKEDIGKVHEFNKYSGRKPLFEGKEDLRSYEINWNSIEKKKVSVDFVKGYSKIKDLSVN